jgi:uncharacterized protein YneF (UPF0154 family)
VVSDTVMIYEGKRQWWNDRRIKLAITVAVLLGLIVGLIIGHILSLIYAHEMLAKASPIYAQLVARGDAAMAMLKKVHDQIAHVEGQPDRNRKRVVLTDAMNNIAGIVKGPSTTVGG